jgi:hypothetical protein
MAMFGYARSSLRDPQLDAPKFSFLADSLVETNVQNWPLHSSGG